MARLREAEVTADEAMRGASARSVNWTKEIANRNGREGMNDGLYEIRFRRTPAAPVSSLASRRARPFDRRARAGYTATALAARRRPSTFCARATTGRAFPRSAGRPRRQRAARPCAWIAASGAPRRRDRSLRPGRSGHACRPRQVRSRTPPTPVQDGPLESAAENEGMPPLRAPTRLRPGQPARTMKNPIATY